MQNMLTDLEKAVGGLQLTNLSMRRDSNSSQQSNSSNNRRRTNSGARRSSDRYTVNTYTRSNYAQTRNDAQNQVQNLRERYRKFDRNNRNRNSSIDMTNVWTIKRIRQEVQRILNLQETRTFMADVSSDVIRDFTSTMFLFNIQNSVKSARGVVGTKEIEDIIVSKFQEVVDSFTLEEQQVNEMYDVGNISLKKKRTHV
eukprot:UN27448